MYRMLLWGMLAGLALASACAPKVDDEPVDPAVYGRPVRWACVGDSITFCDDCWPVHLRKALDGRWDIGNFSAGGATVFASGDVPFIKLKLPEVVAFEPDVVVIFLGTNDSKPRHWYYKKEFEQDYHTLIETLKASPGHPRIWICLPPPAFPGQWGIDDGRIREMQPVIRRVARQHAIPVIDLYTPFAGRSERFPDQIHPDQQASREIADIIHQAVVGTSISPATR